MRPGSRRIPARCCSPAIDPSRAWSGHPMHLNIPREVAWPELTAGFSLDLSASKSLDIAASGINQVSVSVLHKVMVDYWAVVSAVLFSMLVGILLGWYPALRASRLAPIEAIRPPQGRLARRTHRAAEARSVGEALLLHLGHGIHLQARLGDEKQCIPVLISATPEVLEDLVDKGGRKELVGFTDGARGSAQGVLRLPGRAPETSTDYQSH